VFWLYLITDRAGSRAVLRSRPDEEGPSGEPRAIVVSLGCFEGAREAVGALAQLETRLSRERPHVRPSLPAGGHVPVVKPAC
jgi:hypothetical protein